MSAAIRRNFAVSESDARLLGAVARRLGAPTLSATVRKLIEHAATDASTALLASDSSPHTHGRTVEASYSLTAAHLETLSLLRQRYGLSNLSQALRLVLRLAGATPASLLERVHAIEQRLDALSGRP